VAEGKKRIKIVNFLSFNNSPKTESGLDLDVDSIRECVCARACVCVCVCLYIMTCSGGVLLLLGNGKLNAFLWIHTPLQQHFALLERLPLCGGQQ
jgi:hypothetical protein